MTLIYQGKERTTEAGTLDELVDELKLDRRMTLLEFNGEAIAPGSDLTLPLSEGDTLNAFRIVAGG